MPEIEKLRERVKNLKTKVLSLIMKDEELYGQFYTDLFNIEKGLKEYEKTISRLPKQTEETDKLLSLKRKMRELKATARGYIMDYFWAAPKSDYPYLIPNYLSEREGKFYVDVHPLDRVETIDTFINILTPGAYVFIYGLKPIWKSLLGPWTSSFPVSPSCIIRTTPLKKVLRDKLPEEAPYDKQLISLELPESIRLKKVPEKEGFRACTLCGSIVDGTGDENCTHEASLVNIRNPPRIYPVVKTFVEREEEVEKAVKSLPYPFNEIFFEIVFSRKLLVTRFLYGAERSFLNQLWKIYFDPLLGYNMETSGMRFTLNMEKVKELLSNLPEVLKRDLAILYLIHKLSMLIRIYGGRVSDARLIIGSIIASYSAEEGLPKTREDSVKMVEYAMQNPEDHENYLEKFIRIYFGERTPTCYSSIRRAFKEILLQLSKVSDTEFQDFVIKVFVHTFKHYLYLASMLTVGVNSNELAAQFSDEEIHVFDDAMMGNGCSETLSGMIYIPYRERVSSILDSSSKHELGMHSDDLIGVIEELLFGCESEVIGKLYFDLVHSCSKGTLTELIKDYEKLRSQFRGRISNKVLGRLFGLLKQPDYTHEITRLVGPYDELWLYQKFPELLIVSNEEEIGSGPGTLERIIDALSLCIDGCPNCILLSRCSYGPLSSHFYLSRRTVEHAHRLLIRPSMIEVGDSKAEIMAKKIAQKYRVIYVKSTGEKLPRAISLVNDILTDPEYGKAYMTHVYVAPEEHLFKLTFEGG